MRSLAVLIAGLLLGGCASLVPEKLPKEPPPLAGMEEPLELHAEPDDEKERRELPRGGFTGLTVGAGWRTLDEAADDGTGVLVKDVIENSPADAVGLRHGDLLLVAVDASGEEHELRWPSQWRNLEIAAEPGSELTVTYDRAGVESEATMTVIARVRVPGRKEAERFREEERVGVVLRTATEVEARRIGLGPGAGAVVVGLSRDCPWRDDGIRYRDLIVAVNGRAVDHPQVVLDAIRDGGDEVEIEFVRKGKRRTKTCALSRRESELTRFNFPIIVDYENDRGFKELSILLGLLRYEATPAAWEWRFLWIFRSRGGDADRLQEVD